MIFNDEERPDMNVPGKDWEKMGYIPCPFSSDDGYPRTWEEIIEHYLSHDKLPGKVKKTCASTVTTSAPC